MPDTNFDDYRNKAEECRERARHAQREDDRAAWLEMADEWQRVAETLDAYGQRLEEQAARSASEKRAAPRTPTFLRARAICRPDDSPVECLITDISVTGARLQFSDGGMDSLPERFDLLMVKSGQRPLVRVAWRTRDQMGVAFETPLTDGDAA